MRRRELDTVAATSPAVAERPERRPSTNGRQNARNGQRRPIYRLETSHHIILPIDREIGPDGPVVLLCEEPLNDFGVPGPMAVGGLFYGGRVESQIGYEGSNLL